MKKVGLRNIYVVALVVMLGLGTSLVKEGSRLISADIRRTPAVIQSGYHPQGRPSGGRQSGQIQQPGGSVTTSGLPASTETSANWAGYIVTPTSSDSYSSVSGSWTVPNIPVGEQDAVAAQWIGLGGVSATDLLQMGTIEQIENHQPVAEVFWEKLPDVSKNVLTIPVGSTISVSIAESASSVSTWSLTFTATTPSGKTETQTITVPIDSSYVQGMGTSAEWISEDPANAEGRLYPLANMGTVSYRSAQVDGQPLNSSGNVQPVAMVSNNGSVLVAPSALGTDAESFTTNALSTNRNSRWAPRRGLAGFPGSHHFQVNWSDGENGSYSWSWSWVWY